MATTINQYSIGLTLDANDYIAKSKLTASETRKLVRQIEEARTPAEKYGREFDRLSSAVEKGAIDLNTYSRLLENLGKKYGMLDREVKAVAVDTEALAREQQRINQLTAEGERLTQSLLTQEQKRERELRRLRELYDSQSIGMDTFRKAVDRVNESYRRQAESERMASAEVQKHNRLMEEGRRVTQATSTANERLLREMGGLNRLYKAGAIDLTTYNRAMAQLNQTTAKSSAPISGVGSEIRTLAAGYIGLSTVTKSIRMAADAEMAAASFEVLTGSIEGSRYILSELLDLAAQTPITFTGMQDAAKLMMAFNVPANEVIGNLEMLSDISMGNQQRFDMLALAFSQASAAGRLMGQDLLQMVNAGFNPLQEISKRTGESLTDLRKRMEAGKIGIDEVKQAFTDATSEGGKFNGMSDRIAETMGGKIAVAASSLEQAMIGLGNATSSFTIALTDGFTEGTSAIGGLLSVIETMFDGLGFFVAATRDIASNVKAAVTLDFDELGVAEAMHNYYDLLDARDRERAAMQGTMAGAESLNTALASGVALTGDMATAAARVGESYDDIMAKLEMQTYEQLWGVRAAEKLRLIESGLTDEQAERVLKLQEMNDEYQKQLDLEKKITEERVKQAQAAAEDFQSAIEDAFDSNMESALAAARQYFEREAQQWDRMLQQVQQSPRGIEAGSAEAASFMAQLENNLIGAAAMPDRPTVGDEQIVEEARRQFEELQRQSVQNDRQYVLLREMLAVQQENGFRRIR